MSRRSSLKELPLHWDSRLALSAHHHLVEHRRHLERLVLGLPYVHRLVAPARCEPPPRRAPAHRLDLVLVALERGDAVELVVEALPDGGGAVEAARRDEAAARRPRAAPDRPLVPLLEHRRALPGLSLIHI